MKLAPQKNLAHAKQVQELNNVIQTLKTERNDLLKKIEDSQNELSKVATEKTNELLIQIKAQFKLLEADFNELKQSTDAEKSNGANAAQQSNQNSQQRVF